MNSQQLQEARQALWRQDGKPITTLEEARSWLDKTGMCLWQHRGDRFAAPMPTLMEACAGAVGASPSRETVTRASELLARLVDSGAAVPLNLFGTNIALEGERADFVVSAAAFPYVYALRGAKPWKSAPPTAGMGRVSTLALRVWETLQTRDSLSLSEIRELVGHDISDAGVLRALAELWSSLRVCPIPQLDGQPARWQLLSKRFAKQLNAGSSMGQAAALSALISLYLGAVIAASTEEIETALSPMAARSRVGEVVRALEANRQIEFTPVGGALLMHFAGVEDQLPAAVEVVLPAAPVDAAASVPRERPERFTPRQFEPRSPRPPRDRRPERGGEKRPFVPRERRGSAPRAPRDFERTPRREFAGPRESRGAKPFRSSRPAREGERKQFSREGERKPFVRDGERKPFSREVRPRAEGGKPFEQRPLGEGGKTFAPRKPFAGKQGGFKKFAGKPGEQRSGGFGPRPARFGSRPDSRAGSRPERPERSEATSREGAERRPWKNRPEGKSFDRPAGKSFDRSAGKSFDRPARKSFEAGKSFTRPARKSFDRPEGKSFDRPAGKSFARPAGKSFERPARKSFDRPSGKSFARPAGKSFDRARSSERPSVERGERKSYGQPKPFGERKTFGKSSSGKPSFGKPYGKSSGKSFSGRSRGAAPSGESAETGRGFKKPAGGASRGASRPSFGKSSFGKRPGSFGKRSGGAGSRPGGSGSRPGGSRSGGFGKRPGGGKPRG